MADYVHHNGRCITRDELYRIEHGDEAYGRQRAAAWPPTWRSRVPQGQWLELFPSGWYSGSQPSRDELYRRERGH